MRNKVVLHKDYAKIIMNAAKQGNKGGRPVKFKDPEEMAKKIIEFFKWCTDEKVEPTITGLALELGITRKTLSNYEKKDKFLSTIKSAKQIVQHRLESHLFSKGSTVGIMFNLMNNFDWENKQSVNANIKGTTKVEVSFKHGKSKD